MAVDTNVLKELEKLAQRSKVFVSMPYVRGLTPTVMEQEGRFVRVQTDEGIERRHGVFNLNEAALSVMDHGTLYGDGAFEGILISNSRLFVFREHIKRWWRSAETMKIRMPYSPAELAYEIVKLVRESGFGAHESAYLRPVVTRGFGNLGINPAKCVAPTIFVISSTITLYPPERYETGIELTVARTTRRPGRRFLDPNVKSCNYLNNIYALLETAGRTLETLMLTADGFVAEATADNLFLVRKNEGWETDPSRVTLETPVRDYCLVGITRNLVMQQARAEGYQVLERADMLPSDLLTENREVFMTGTGCGMMPIIALDGCPIGDGTPGPVTKKLLTRIRDRMRDKDYGLSIDATEAETQAYLEAPLVVEP
ncbi:MAG: aminotransferase class IV [Myxococcota bacterium]|jgi:branched-chain amino acid aminotransferase|nr:aminotransferase class IV [Myxococcota bacterium]